MVVIATCCYAGTQHLIIHLYDDIPVQKPWAIDTMIPLTPHFVFIYGTLPIIIFVGAFKAKPTNFKTLILAAVIAQVIAYPTFIIFPSQMERFDLNEFNGILKECMRLTYEWDMPLNTWPSLHVTYCILMVQCIGRKNILMYLWAIAVILSTLFIKQHMFFDVITGLLLSYFSWFLANKLYTRHTLSKNTQ